MQLIIAAPFDKWLDYSTDDPFEDIGYDYIKFFNLINKSDEETEYKELNAILMVLASMLQK